jgi:hypothetical protein
MEPGVTAAAALVGWEVTKSAARLLERALGKGADALGDRWAEAIGLANKRTEAVVEQAAKALDDAGVEAQEVPLKILAPILQRSGLETDDDLSKRWAALLANAANPSHAPKVLPIFPHILSLLAPEDARLLDLIDKEELQNAVMGQQTTKPWVVRGDLVRITGWSQDDVDVSLSSLLGHGLIERQPSMDYMAMASDPEPFLVPTDQQGHAMTPLGRRFLQACRPPISSVTRHSPVS